MSLVGFKANNHPQQVGKRGRDELTDDRGTDPVLFEHLSWRFGGFTLDVAAAPRNAKCERYFTEADDGLSKPWGSERVWCNPPYSNLRAWTGKAWTEHLLGCPLIVMLLPANRTEQAWWQDTIEPRRDRPGGPRVEFMAGRPRFVKPGCDSIGPNERPPFGCCLVIFEQTT